jgi:hypothetical protein
LLLRENFNKVLFYILTGDNYSTLVPIKPIDRDIYYQYGCEYVKVIRANIRKLRKLNNLNQVEFSSYIGISQGNLSEIEQGVYVH